MLNYDEIVTRTEAQRALLLTNAEQQRLTQSLVASQPHPVSAWIGQQLIVWGQRLQGQSNVVPAPAAPATIA
ncbi:MAG: hypothetical protein DYG89_36165 [Caldilinea sp. CFX5]|nr:hypothetical protein [Caldilinea sp. CFX5]